jgi:hypothetical protein
MNTQQIARAQYIKDLNDENTTALTIAMIQADLNTDLTQKLTVYIPSTMHAKTAPIQTTNAQRLIFKKFFSTQYGGYTETISTGGYFSETLNTTIEEKIFRISTNATAPDAIQSIEELLTLIQELKSEMKQEAVTLEINNQLYFI